MADSASASLPPPPPSAAAPGYDGGNQQHMPPPQLAPVIIPQNNNPIPTAISSPMSGNPMSPTSGGPGYAARRAAPEPNKRALYVGGLDPRVTEDVLRQIFETTGHVQSVKIIPDKTATSPQVSRLLDPVCCILPCQPGNFLFFSSRMRSIDPDPFCTCSSRLMTNNWLRRASTTDSSNTMTLQRLSEAWRLSTAAASTTT